MNLDAPFVTENDNERYNVAITLLFENFDADKIKNLFIENGIKKLKKLRTVLEYKFFNYWWKEIKDDEKLNKMIAKVFINVELEKEDELYPYTQKELHKFLNIFDSEKLLIEIHLIKFKNSEKGAIIFKTDHILSDGLGFVSLICALADNYSDHLFPQVMRGKVKSTWMEDFIDMILFPYNMLKLSLRVAFNKVEKSPFKKLYDTERTKHTGKTIMSYSVAYPLKKLENVRKTLHISFNDLVVSIISHALKLNFPKIENMNFVLANGKTGVPHDVTEVQIKNQSGGIFLRLPLINNITEESKIISKKLISNLKNTPFSNTPNMLMNLIIEYLPAALINYINSVALDKVDMILSNVPGPTTNLYYAGCKIVEMYPFISTGRAKVFVPVFSYNKNFRILVNYDKSIGLNPHDLLNTVDEIINSLEKKFSN